jgi:hypothetical protein
MVAAGWKEATVAIPLKKEARFFEISTGQPRYRRQLLTDSSGGQLMPIPYLLG